eukprot:jgi/Psemu1/7384/gm1.7384_g
MTGGTQVNLSFNAQRSIGPNLDLRIIDDTYGKNADLYEDVLRVPMTATHEEIQKAYFDRRSELFTLLAKLDAAARGPQSASPASLASIDKRRYLAERKMESVVIVVRILAEPALRKAYDKIRTKRTGIEEPSAASDVGQNLQYAASLATSSSASESKNWIQSTLSSPIFSSFSTSKAYDGDGDDVDDDDDDDEDRKEDEERNPRKSKRRQKLKKQFCHSNRDLDSERVQENLPERSTEQEKKSIWGRKKRKKKAQQKNSSLNDSIDTNATDLSLTDNEETHNHGTNSKKIEETYDVRPSLSIRSSTSQTTDYDSVSPYEVVKRGGELRNSNQRRQIVQNETLEDDDDTTRRDDDTRTFMGDDGETFATASIFSKDYDDDYTERGPCGGAFGCIAASKTIKSITDELSGACEDTLVSVDQVFHAFTLTDKDIKAVTKKIHKAQRQLDN